MAQQGTEPPTFDELRARLEQQDQQIHQLQAQVSGLQAAPAAAPPAVAPAGGPAGAPNPANPYQIGSDLSVKLSLKDGLFLWMETPNKDFTMHLGGWIQWDNVWWGESPGLATAAHARTPPPAGASGVAAGGIGPLEDGDYFRRIRPFAEGTFWEFGEFRLIPALENNQYSTSGLDEFWVGVTGVPVLGTVRVGHVKTPMGLEGDMTGSSREMTFMERSSYSEAIELNQNFGTGISFSDNYFDQRMTWMIAAFRPDNGSSGDFFGDGQSGVQGRLTGLALYEDEGRHLLHLGISGGWRDGSTNLANSPLNTIQLRARPELRDDDPAGSPSGAQALPNADSSRMIDTGLIAANTEYLMGLETMYIRGPFSFQAEYGFNWVDNAVGILAGTTFHPLPSPQNYMFHGGYVQVAYTLTGESRGPNYDKRFGAMGRYYLGNKGPFSNAWFVRDENGRLIPSWGAWEIAARYSYVNLNDGSGANRIQGGEMEGLSLALNWYLNTNLTVMMDWVYDNRYDVPADTIAGYTNGFGVEVQFQF
jgi:phosphate-selective porin OprO/OprP